MYPQDFLFIFHGFLCVLVYGSSISHTRRGLGAGVTQVVDFDCPEEFGYYPHPTDCTQYYVCVFGGALLESCTGGLMYSHELQTCDWPRNVGCGESSNSEGGTISTVRVTDPRTRNPQQGRSSTSPQQSPVQVQPTRSSHPQDYNRPHQQEVIQQQLYAEEDLGPAEEVESDRQQRVYRGQPSSIGQIQRDRDGLRPLKNSVHSQNVIPTGPGTQDKISVVSFGSQRPSAPRPQEQYRLSDSWTNLAKNTDRTDNVTDVQSRSKRQIFTRTQQTALQVPYILIPGSYQTGIRSHLSQPLSYHIEYYQPPNLLRHHQRLPSSELVRHRQNEELLRLTKSTIQTEFRPIHYSRPTREEVQETKIQKANYIESIINPLSLPRVKIGTKPSVTTSMLSRPAKKQTTNSKLFSSDGFIKVTTEIHPKYNTTVHQKAGNYKTWYGPTKTVNHDVKITPTTIRPSLYGYIQKPKDYDLRFTELESTTKEKRNATFGLVRPNRYVPYVMPQEYEYEYDEEATQQPKTTWHTTTPQPDTTLSLRKNMSFFDFIDEFGFRDAEEIKAAFKTNFPTTTENVPVIPSRQVTSRPKYSVNQIESPREKIPEEYYENFKPLPTQSFYLTQQPDTDNDRHFARNTNSRVEQVQSHQLTSALPPLSPTPRPIDRYNTSQRFQPSQFDQYYTVFDDGVEIYRSNDYSQQFQSPSSTPSSQIAHQYRGQTTYKQSLEEHAQEPVQQHKNTYNQDLYSPPPVLQDFNDQYNVQIDDQQYQQLGQPSPKPSSRSETTNSSKDALTESSVSVTRVPENVTSTSQASPIIRRSDSNSYFSVPSFGPSTVLLPPLRFDTTSPPSNSEKPIFKSFGSPNFEPPKNGGALAKTFNSFDSLLSSFIAAVTKSNRATSTPVPSTTTPLLKAAPETIVRSEIGRIHHDPIVITENFKIRQPVRRPEPETKQVSSSVPSPSSTPVPLSGDDYLAYFVEIEPKKSKLEPSGFLLTKPDKPEATTEPRIVTKDSARFGQGDSVSFNIGGKAGPFNSFVRLVPSSQTQKVQLGTTLALEPIAKPQEKKKVFEETQNETIEKQKLIGPITTVSQQPIGKWVIAKNERPQTPGFQVQSKPFDPYLQKNEPEITTLKHTKLEAVSNRGRGNVLHIQAEAEPGLQTVVSSPYKFLLVDVDSTTEQLSTPAPFIRNPENEERNRFVYKTNPESRVRPRFYDNSTTGLGSERRPFLPERVQVPTEATTAYAETEDRFKFSYKTNPETRFRNRYVGSSLIEDKLEEITPKIIVPDEESEERPSLEFENPTQVLTEVETEEPELVALKRRKPEFRAKEIEVTTRKPYFRYRSTTESEEVKNSSEELKKPPRRVVKIHRNDLKNQRLSPKLKRVHKPSTRSPIIVLEDLEEKALAKENEIHPTYRPIVVSDALDGLIAKNKTRFRFTVEEEKDFETIPNNRIGPIATTEKFIIDTVPRGFEKVGQTVPSETDNDVPDKPEKPLFPAYKRPPVLKNVTLFDNRATTKAYRGKFKPSDSSKLRLRPTTASPDSESTPGPHLSTRQPGTFSIGSTGNEVTVNRGTPAPNRGTRPTLKPSTAIVSKASEFIDIYRYPPRRPQNIYATPTPDKSAAKCRKDVCLLPDCSCGGKDIPGGYSAEEIPQLVLLTFDDSVNDLNKGLYQELFERGRVNPNGCPISATFYVSHEWTDYSQVQNLYANGHEIASHSITHSFGEQFSQKKWTKEIAGQREILAAYGGVRLEDIRGMRAPFLAVGGNKMFKMLYDSNFTYDSSMPIYENRPPSWPYTLDYKLFHDCMIPPCPTKSYPGVWEVPMVMWQDLNGGRCSMGDACSNPPTADGVYKMLIKNFERHFTTNRAPFGLYYHAAWFTHEHHKEGFIAFLDTIVNMPEVWLVTSWQAIEWVRDPQPLSTVQNFPPFQCNVEKAKKCNNPKVCNLWHKSGVRYMRTCQPCPDVYPWTGKTGVKNSRVDNEIDE